MNRLKENVINYLNMGLNPTVVSFEDDGLYYLFEKLLNGTLKTNSYDPVFTFVHVSLSYIPEVNIESLEIAIEEGLKRDKFVGDTIIETYDNGIETVCVLDDLAFIDDASSAIKAANILFKKYRGILKFVFIVEDPLLINNLKDQISPLSIFFDAIIHKPIGEFWTKEELSLICEQQFKQKLADEVINKISTQSNNHYGIFKRLYKDEVLKSNSTNRYLHLLIESLDKTLLNTFKKVVKHFDLSSEEGMIYKTYEDVGFFNNNTISIPLIEGIVEGIIIPNKISLDLTSGHLSGIDLNQLNKIERTMLETLMKTNTVISKHQLGDVIWQDKSTEKYSEWAIDQRISRLRKKLIDLGFNVDIQTIYGQGYKLAIINKK